MPKVARPCLTKVQEAEARLVARYCPLRVSIRLTPNGPVEHCEKTCGKKLRLRECNMNVSEYSLYCPEHGYVHFNGASI